MDGSSVLVEAQGPGRITGPLRRLEVAEPQVDGIGRAAKGGNPSAAFAHLQRTRDAHLAGPPCAKIKLLVGALEEFDPRRPKCRRNVRLRFTCGRRFGRNACVTRGIAFVSALASRFSGSASAVDSLLAGDADFSLEPWFGRIRFCIGRRLRIFPNLAGLAEPIGPENIVVVILVAEDFGKLGRKDQRMRRWSHDGCSNGRCTSTGASALDVDRFHAHAHEFRLQPGIAQRRGECPVANRRSANRTTSRRHRGRRGRACPAVLAGFDWRNAAVSSALPVIQNKIRWPPANVCSLPTPKDGPEECGPVPP